MAEQRTKAGRYAQAILEATLEQWQSALVQVSDALAQNPDLNAKLEGSQLSADAKMKEINKILPKESAESVKNFLKLLVQEGDLGEIPGVLGSLQGMVSGQTGPSKVDVVSAAEMADAEKDQIRQSMTSQYGEGLVFDFRVDPALMGGLRVRIGDTLIDNSVASRLVELREIINASVR